LNALCRARFILALDGVQALDSLKGGRR